jgi:hypothetical protein
MAKYLYPHQKHNKNLQKMLFMPINRVMQERKLTWDEMASILNQNGFKCTKTGLISTQQGKNFFAVNFDYFTRMYNVFNIDLVNVSYLLECEQVYNKLKPQKRN